MLVLVYMHPDSWQMNSSNNPLVISKVVQEAWSNGYTSKLLILQQVQRFACA